jgi:hypothetical protein
MRVPALSIAAGPNGACGATLVACATGELIACHHLPDGETRRFPAPVPRCELCGSASLDEKTSAAGSDRPIEEGFCPVCDGRRPEAGYEWSTGGRLTLRAKVVFWARCHRCLFGAEIGAIYPKGLKERQQARSWKTPAWLQGQGEHTTLSAICSSCTNSFSLRFKWASIVYPTRALNLRRTTLAWIVPDPTAWKRNQGISSFLLLVSDQIEIGSRGPFGGNARFPHSRGLEDVL